MNQLWLVFNAHLSLELHSFINQHEKLNVLYADWKKTLSFVLLFTWMDSTNKRYRFIDFAHNTAFYELSPGQAERPFFLVITQNYNGY